MRSKQTARFARERSIPEVIPRPLSLIFTPGE